MIPPPMAATTGKQRGLDVGQRARRHLAADFQADEQEKEASSPSENQSPTVSDSGVSGGPTPKREVDEGVIGAGQRRVRADQRQRGRDQQRQAARRRQIRERMRGAADALRHRLLERVGERIEIPRAVIAHAVDEDRRRPADAVAPSFGDVRLDMGERGRVGEVAAPDAPCRARSRAPWRGCALR